MIDVRDSYKPEVNRENNDWEKEKKKKESNLYMYLWNKSRPCSPIKKMIRIVVAKVEKNGVLSMWSLSQ
jgi:hypothetical protein